MPFQMPITIAEVLRRIQTQDNVLPAIQRELVWSPEQMARLFDSLMRDYPIGSFLFWKIEAAHASDFTFYGFIRDYHQKDAPHCPALDLPSGKSVTAILDGQQRLTALNIGLRGSHAAKLPWKRAGVAAAYPKRRLHLNLCAEAPENELGIRYDFRFFETPPPSDPVAGVHWFPVHRILDESLGDAGSLFEYVLANGLNQAKQPFQMLNRLHKVVHDAAIINFYEETTPDLDKVLDIFIRVNSGGTVLSYSDLLLSIAIAQWKTRDARREIHDFVDELNDIGQGFAFTKDVVLKAGLVLTEVADIGFKVTNFNRVNMAKLEEQWDPVMAALRLAAGLLSDFGLSGATLTANSILIPLAYYLHRAGVGDAYRTSSKYADDRTRVRRWVVRTLIKPGIWGSGLDTLLRELRRVIAAEGAPGFPTEAVEAAMAARGKALAFTPEEIADLVDTRYGDKRVFPLLALLYPHVDTRNLFHVDHVFPRALFKRSALEQAGLDPAHVDDYVDMANSLPNLQLLEGTLNVEKQDTLPAVWAAKRYPDEPARLNYFAIHDLTVLPEHLGGFPEFFEVRRQRMAAKLSQLLGVSLPPEGLPPQLASTPSNGPVPREVDVSFIREVLTRREVSDRQRAVLTALAKVGDAGLSYSELATAIGRSQDQLNGALGALGKRINGTPRADMAAHLGIGTLLELWFAEGEWHYRLRPETRQVAEELGLVAALTLA